MFGEGPGATQALVVGLKELEWVTCLWLDLHKGLHLRDARMRSVVLLEPPY